MKKSVFNFLAIAIIVFVWAVTGFSADEYVSDPVHSTISFKVRHMVINKVRGKFNKFNTRFVYDPATKTISRVEATIDAASVDTNNKRRDADLKSSNFLDVQKFPEIVFKSNQIKKDNDGWIAYGELTIHGITRKIALPFELNGPIKDPWGNIRLGVEAHLTINRQDFGITWNKTLDNGGLVVGNKIEIEIQEELVKKTAKTSAN